MSCSRQQDIGCTEDQTVEFITTMSFVSKQSPLLMSGYPRLSFALVEKCNSADLVWSSGQRHHTMCVSVCDEVHLTDMKWGHWQHHCPRTTGWGWPLTCPGRGSLNQPWFEASYIHCVAAPQSRCFVLISVRSSAYPFGCTVSAVSAKRPMEHVKHALQNITTEQTPYTVVLLLLPLPHLLLWQTGVHHLDWVRRGHWNWHRVPGNPRTPVGSRWGVPSGSDPRTSWRCSWWRPSPCTRDRSCRAGPCRCCRCRCACGCCSRRGSWGRPDESKQNM